MKKTFVLLIFTFLFSGCIQMRYITEQHIKTTKEIHSVGKFSEIKLYPIFRGFTNKSTSSYIELTGYKFNGNKKLVIAADTYYKARRKFVGDNTYIADIEFIELNLEECKSIVKNYEILLDKLKQIKPKRGEVVYQDYTVSEDLFISFSKSKLSGESIELDLWIKGKKFSINSKQIINKFKKFLKY